MVSFGPVPMQERSAPVKRGHGEPKIPDSGRYGSTYAKLANKSFQGDL